MKLKENIINILKDINSENKRKKFLIYFFTSTALLSLSAFGIKGFSDGRITYSIIIFVFFIIAFANLIILKFFNKIILSAHIMLFLMFMLELELFCSLGTGISGLFWYYVFPPLAITLLNNKKGTIYSLILIAVTVIILVVKPDFLTNTYSNEIIFRFIFTYLVVGILINIFEYARNTAHKAYLSNLTEIKEKNDELLSAEEELRQNNEQLQLLYDNIQSQKDIIKEKEHRLKTIIDTQGEGFAIIALNGTFTFNNPAADDIFDLPKNGLLGKNVSDFFNKEQIVSFMVLADKLKPGKKETIELHITTPKGNKKTILVTITPDFNKENKISGLAGILRDITELKKVENEIKEKNSELTAAEEELRQNNEELQSLNDNIQSQKDIIENRNQELQKYFTAIEQSAASIFFTDIKGNIEYANPQFAKLTGYTVEEALGKNPVILKSGKTPKSRIKELWDTILNRKTWRGEFINRKKDGKEFYEKAIISPITNDKEEITDFVAIKEDITELKKAQQIIEEKTKQQQILINNLPAHIYFKDENLKYILVNNSYAQLLNHTNQEIIGKTDDDVSPAEIAEIYQKIDREIIQSKTSVPNFEEKHINNKGEKYWASTSKVPYFDKNNNVIGIVGIVQDITERKKQEQIIIEKNKQITIAHKNITQSINYAKSIQNALLPTQELENKLLKEHFILFLPKENVSGDFYYVNKTEDNKLLFAAADCTGHGVPGGFMTMLSITILNGIINRDKEIKPSNILEQLRERIKGIFNQFGAENQNGLDIAFCSVDTKTNVLQYAGAYNPLWIIRNNELLEHKATRNPIGFYPVEKEFENNEIQLHNNDLIYLFSDGYQDQLGEAGKGKFSKKRFREILLEIHKLPLSEQKVILTKTLQDWTNGEDQIDDITVMGVKWEIK